jgi:cytochrome c-type biogenesis protein CcmH
VSVFWIVAALLAGAALAFLLPPLWRSHASAARTDRDASNAGLYRDQVADLDRELAAGSLREEQHREAKLEIERRLLEDVGTRGASAQAAARARRWVPLAVAAVIPVIAVSLYFWVGNPAALDPAARTAPDAAHSVTSEQIAAMVDRLAERLKQTPEDAEAWVMLARSFGVIGRFDESAQAYAHVTKLVPNDAGLLADYADVLGMARGRRLEGEPYEIVKRALKADPNHVKSLALAGSAEFELRHFAAAVAYWERILPLVGADSEYGRSIQASIDDARNQGKIPAGSVAKAVPAPAAAPEASPAGTITGTVKLNPALASQVAAGDTLFVFARPAEGSRMPLAIVRAKAGDLPYEFRLDDSQAMTANARLSGQAQVVVGARISKTGNAMSQPGDLFGASSPVAPGASGLALVIDQVQK